MNDLRYALRQLLRQPGFTILAVVALALGIGANTVLFSAINTLFLRPLSYPQPKQLVRAWGSFPERGLDRANVSWPRFSAWRDQQQSFSEFSAQSFTGFTLTGRGDPENLQGFGSPRISSARSGSNRFSAALSPPMTTGRAVRTSLCSATFSGRNVSAATKTSSASQSCSTARPSPSSASCRLR